MSTLENLKSNKNTAEPLATRERRVRTPISGRRSILTVSGKDPNYEYRWVINDPDRVDGLMEVGYEPVKHKVRIGERSVEQGGEVGAIVTRRAGGGVEYVLMRILKEWYIADQKAKQRDLDAQEATIKGKQDREFYGKHRGTAITEEVKIGSQTITG